MSFIKNRSGQLSLQIIIFSSVVVVIITGFIFLAVSFLQLSTRSVNSTLAFSIAEAGVEYYRWHLAHDPDDFMDGTGQPGPYVHSYYDKNGKRLGEYELLLEPIENTSMVDVTSTGRVTGDASLEKVIKVRLGKPSLAKYAVAANADMRFGAGTEVFGEIFVNGGVRFDGVSHNVIRSAQEDYNDPDHSGGNEFGVHTHVSPQDPLPPSAVPERTDVFKAGRQFPLPAVDFSGITLDMVSLKALAQNGGVYKGDSNKKGWELVLKTNGTYDLYKVRRTKNAPSSCYNQLNQSNWGTWSVRRRTLIQSDDIPDNGIFFFEDDVWVRGQIDGHHITIGSGKFPDNPSTRTSITVNENLLYTNYDGTDSIGLIAQDNFNIGLFSDNTFRIDAAIVAQAGRVGRYYYRSGCSPNHTRNEVTLYGSLITNKRYGFAYTDGTGYATRNLIYDANLLYGPPPGFPLAADNYELISWEEIK